MTHNSTLQITQVKTEGQNFIWFTWPSKVSLLFKYSQLCLAGLLWPELLRLRLADFTFFSNKSFRISEIESFNMKWTHPHKAGYLSFVSSRIITTEIGNELYSNVHFVFIFRQGSPIVPLSIFPRLSALCCKNTGLTSNFSMFLQTLDTWLRFACI